MCFGYSEELTHLRTHNICFGWEINFNYTQDLLRTLVKSAYQKIIFSYFSTKTYVVGTQKNLLNETVLLSTQNICLNFCVRKYLHFYAEKFCLSKPVHTLIWRFVLSLNLVCIFDMMCQWTVFSSGGELSSQSFLVNCLNSMCLIF